MYPKLKRCKMVKYLVIAKIKLKKSRSQYKNSTTDHTQKRNTQTRGPSPIRLH